MDNTIILEFKKQSVKIEKGELISYKVDGYEFIHQKGSPGWGASDAEMFPIIGPVNDCDFKVCTPKGLFPQDQHGHLRQMDYELTFNAATKAIYRKTYTAGSLVKNSKYPDKSPVEWMEWPHNFEFKKQLELSDEGLHIEFVVSGDEKMPFMLGYHPAFRLTTNTPIIRTNNRTITLDEVLAVESRALEVVDCNVITLKDEKEITIRTEGFGHFMCWTEVSNMICIEPISFYPYGVAQKNLHKGFRILGDKARFKVILSPKLE